MLQISKKNDSILRQVLVTPDENPVDRKTGDLYKIWRFTPAGDEVPSCIYTIETTSI